MNVISVLPKDAIPSIDDPTFGDEYFGGPDDEVLIVDPGDEASPARAYPIRILNYHEIVNDTVPVADGDADSIAVTWCPICGSAVVYEAIVDDRRLTFGVSGKLADDDLVLYDHETDSEWKQSTGECIAGEFAGERLRVRPGPMTTYRAFREAYPDGIVLQPASEGSAAVSGYDPSGYEAYEEREAFGLRGMRGEGPEREWHRDDLDPKTVVLGVTPTDGGALGFPLPVVEAAGGVVEATVGDTDVVVLATDDGLHAFEQPEFELRIESGLVSGDGATWTLTTGESNDGRQLRRVESRRLYAFAWQDDHGRRSFYSL
ncbi:DUF3179 domain-containing protein [Halorubrum sp. SS5]|uniref:DUF3179 domain-containing protein n=2 Tax=Haloferacaceae TaxID=1644056 RepID=A0A7D4C305_9EURY|nr:DUF3179 domain-containing protein [Halorubrum salinarum]TKX57133.1 DUF3179 domain-containing protein [Halorubrum sp. SS7]TKX84558.1 DUF3179 domain-containing protein [Halorubrum sp. SS5]